MNTLVSQVVRTVSAWDGITPEPHRFGGTEFSLGKVEIGHIHNHGMVDIPFTKKIRDALVAQNDALPHHLLVESGWITFYVRSEDDVTQALRLMRLSYLHKRSRRDQGFSAAAEIAQLAFAPEVTAALGHRSASGA